MLDPNKPFLFRGSDDLAVFDQGSRRIAHVRQPEDAHGAVE